MKILMTMNRNLIFKLSEMVKIENHKTKAELSIGEMMLECKHPSTLKYQVMEQELAKVGVSEEKMMEPWLTPTKSTERTFKTILRSKSLTRWFASPTRGVRVVEKLPPANQGVSKDLQTISLFPVSKS